VFYPVFNFVFL